MSIPAVQNNQTSFKGNVIIKNLKTKSVEKFITDTQTDKKIADSFEKVINDRIFTMRSSEDCLKRLKNYIDTFTEITGIKIKNKLDYPSAKNFNAEYKSEGNKLEIHVPEHFNISHVSD